MQSSTHLGAVGRSPPALESGAVAGVGRSPSAQRLLLCLFVLTDFLLNVDAGILPVFLYEFTLDPYRLSRSGQGLLGALSPLGFVISTTYSGVLLQRYPPKWILAGALSLACLAQVGMLASRTRAQLFGARVAYGLFYSNFFVFVPVWVDAHALDGRRGTWLSVMQAVGPLGIMTGFGVAGWGNRGPSAPRWSWRALIGLQVAALLPLVLLLAATPAAHFQVTVPPPSASRASADRSVDAEAAAGDASMNVSGCGASRWEGTPDTSRIGVGRPSPLTAEDRIAPASNGTPGTADDSDMHTPSPPSATAATAAARLVWSGSGGSKRSERTPLLSGGNNVSFASAEGRIRRSLVARNRAERRSFLAQLRTIFSNPLYVCAVSTLTCLCFVAEGLRFWVASYRHDVFQDDFESIVLSFTLVSVTSPISGVFLGGLLTDAQGGYSGVRGLRNALRITAACGLCAAAAAWLCTAHRGTLSLLWFSALLWLVLFFGGAMFPPLTGIMLSSVDAETRSVANSMSLLVTHLFGYFAAPFITGVLADLSGLEAGFDWMLRGMPAVAAVFTLGALITAERRT